MSSPAGARALAALTATVLLGCGLSGCGSDPETAPVAAAVAPAAEPPTPAEQVAAIGLRSKDLRGRASIVTPRGGTGLKQPTFDQCGYDFTSERLRRARRQVVVSGGDPTAAFSNEAVAYRDQRAAERAMREMGKALATCEADTPVTAYGLGPGTRFDVLRAEVGSSRLPAPSSHLLRERMTLPGGQVVHYVIAYQQSGALIGADYLATAAPPSKDQVAELLRHAAVTGARLLAVASPR